MKCLTINLGPETMTIHMLNPGQHFPNFGGSRSGLVVGKTASMITQHRTPNALHDVEHDIHDPAIWKFIADCINGKHKGATAAVDIVAVNKSEDEAGVSTVPAAVKRR